MSGTSTSNTTSNAKAAAAARSLVACSNCRKRKKKCSGYHPCELCRKLRLDCDFALPNMRKGPPDGCGPSSDLISGRTLVPKARETPRPSIQVYGNPSSDGSLLPDVLRKVFLQQFLDHVNPCLGIAPYANTPEDLIGATMSPAQGAMFDCIIARIAKGCGHTLLAESMMDRTRNVAQQLFDNTSPETAALFAFMADYHENDNTGRRGLYESMSQTHVRVWTAKYGDDIKNMSDSPFFRFVVDMRKACGLMDTCTSLDSGITNMRSEFVARKNWHLGEGTSSAAWLCTMRLTALLFWRVLGIGVKLYCGEGAMEGATEEQLREVFNNAEYDVHVNGVNKFTVGDVSYKAQSTSIVASPSWGRNTVEAPKLNVHRVWQDHLSEEAARNTENQRGRADSVSTGETSCGTSSNYTGSGSTTNTNTSDANVEREQRKKAMEARKLQTLLDAACDLEEGYDALAGWMHLPPVAMQMTFNNAILYLLAYEAGRIDIAEKYLPNFLEIRRYSWVRYFSYLVHAMLTLDIIKRYFTYGTDIATMTSLMEILRGYYQRYPEVLEAACDTEEQYAKLLKTYAAPPKRIAVSVHEIVTGNVEPADIGSPLDSVNNESNEGCSVTEMPQTAGIPPTSAGFDAMEINPSELGAAMAHFTGVQYATTTAGLQTSEFHNNGMSTGNQFSELEGLLNPGVGQTVPQLGTHVGGAGFQRDSILTMLEQKQFQQQQQHELASAFPNALQQQHHQQKVEDLLNKILENGEGTELPNEVFF
eukprot:GFYU01001598.1.p1 GENE.GFYU01001598.1~~GFYU01001598.1.p1  ORF type:complete len:761 (-),score=172.56 GFYU01001598.1:176-2458(-)